MSGKFSRAGSKVAPHLKRAILLVSLDILLINIALLASFYLRLEERPGELAAYRPTYLAAAAAATLLIPLIYRLFGLYRNIWRYASIGELWSVALASTAGVGAVVALLFGVSLVAASIPDAVAFRRLPHIVSVLFWLSVMLLTGGARFTQRAGHPRVLPPGGNAKKILIIGAGDAGMVALRELKNGYRYGTPIGFVDDDPQKSGLMLQGVPVLGTRLDIPALVRAHAADEIIIAIPSASGQELREIADICKKTPAALKILPGVYDILSGKLTVSAIREVELEDLLGRAPVDLNVAEVAGYLNGQVVLVTGAGGSIGAELCRQILRFGPRRVILGGHGENSIFAIQQELISAPVTAEIFDIRDEQKIRRVFAEYAPTVVFHAAAHKHVPLMEHNPEEALLNNVLGTRCLARAAHESRVRVFIMISTDKAVHPASVMGASKRIGEMIIQEMNTRSETKFAAVRFGNVLGSRGSVIPTFRRQIREGGPVTVTHPEMTRYFMTIPEACQLVIQAGAMAAGGEIFVLDMGQPVKIAFLAEELIRLSGFEPGEDIQIVYTGIRPGEKLYEELLTEEEGTAATKHRRIFVGRPNHIDREALNAFVAEVRARGSVMAEAEIVALIQTLLPEFRSGTDSGG
ncbi:MAG: polysaccharide biosynthesis protein [Gracilibacteraceae bacterium]|jgi:FlaA1/EpsC-like NDP-sugar epimerase|nr:polysaccharide biosynthesis protein [Gracilibacteraceae bacterium]